MKRRLIAAALAAPFLLGACGTAPDAPAAPATAAAPESTAAAPAANGVAKAVAEFQAGVVQKDIDVMYM